MNVKTCMLTSIIIFAVSMLLSFASYFIVGSIKMVVVLSACLMLIPGWIFNITGWVKLIRG